MYELMPTCFLVWTVLLSVLLKWSQAEVYTSEHNPEVKNTSLATAFICSCSEGNDRNKETLELEAEPGPSSQKTSSVQNQAWTLEGSLDFWTYVRVAMQLYHNNSKRQKEKWLPRCPRRRQVRQVADFIFSPCEYKCREMFLSEGEAVQIQKRLAHPREARVMPWWQEAPGEEKKAKNIRKHPFYLLQLMADTPWATTSESPAPFHHRHTNLLYNVWRN